MIEEPGIVVAVEGGAVWVATQRKTTCGSCAAKAACGQGLLNSLAADKKPHTIKIQSDAQWHEGDQVTLSIGEDSLLRGAFLVYMLPLFFMFAAALGVDALNASEPWIIFAAALGFLGGALWVRLYSHRYLNDVATQPLLVKSQSVLTPRFDV